MELVPFRAEFIPQAADLFVQNFKALRRSVPALPAKMEDPACLTGRLEWILNAFSGLAAVQDGKLAGYLLWLYDDTFRGTDRKGAYVPEWAHGAVEGGKPAIYRALYRAASEQWDAAGCKTHAITLLANDKEAEKTWYWNCFGLLVVDAIRPAETIGELPGTSLTIRKASLEDASGLAELDAEHCRHYTAPPVFMTPRPRDNTEKFQAFLQKPKNSVWMALDGETTAGFIRFTGDDFDGVSLVEADDAVTINGAYVRPAYRGQKAARYMLDAALRDYASQGIRRCAVNFESFNPEAASFWMKYFTPVCYSLIRVPESVSI